MANDWFLGNLTRTDAPAAVSYDPDDLTTHGVIVGMTGSGKTGLAVVALEEAIRNGTPALVIDPKGDMTNLLLNFPEFRPADFEPWVNEGDARKDGVSVPEFATAEAAKWQSGLERDGLGTPEMRALLDAAEFTVYTPGSSAGVPVNIIGDLDPPPAGSPDEAVADEINGFVTGLLGLIGIDADPLASREHVLLSNLVDFAWSGGKPITFATLIGQVIDPPMRKLGVFDVDTFFPKDARTKLAMQLNGLLASPSFAGWMEGAPLDIGRMLYGGDGTKPRVAILSIAHLSEEERQFVVTAALSKVATWMRGQPGTSGLRAVVYMDEVFGYCPPTAEPPSKKPILTLLKQARAFGVGLLLATQNPVDLDYKAMSNAGTWMVGRLQTERDKERLVEGLRSAAGGVDPGELSATISSLEKREFVYHNTHGSGGPTTFSTRWAMSYLRGPLTRDQIALLASGPNHTVPASGAPGVEPAPAAQPGTATPPAAATPEASALAANESTVAPTVAEGTPVFFLDAAAPWAADLGAVSASTHFEPAIVARVATRFDEAKAKFDHQDEYEAVFYPLAAALDPAAAIKVDYDARDLRPSGPDAAIYTLPDAPLDRKTYFSGIARDLKAHLHRSLTVEILHNAELKLYSRAGETAEEFDERCERAARDAADAEAAKIRDRFDSKMDRLRETILRDQDRLEQLKTDTSSRKQHNLISTAGDLLGAFFGGKRDAKSLASKAGRIGKGVSSRQGMSSRTDQRLKTAERRLESTAAKVEDLEDDLLDELAEIDEKWSDVAGNIAPVAVGLEANDIQVTQVALVWVPVDR